jgi:hypothetical protein
VKSIVLILLLAVACRSTPSYGNTAGERQLAGAASPRAAVETFLAAVSAQDLQAMSVIWGTPKGPARDQVDREQLERRELIMQCYLSHDKFAIQSDSRTGAETHALAVSLTKGPLTRQATFTTVLGPSNRWYVQDVPLEPLKDLCTTP